MIEALQNENSISIPINIWYMNMSLEAKVFYNRLLLLDANKKHTLQTFYKEIDLTTHYKTNQIKKYTNELIEAKLLKMVNDTFVLYSKPQA